MTTSSSAVESQRLQELQDLRVQVATDTASDDDAAGVRAFLETFEDPAYRGTDLEPIHCWADIEDDPDSIRLTATGLRNLRDYKIIGGTDDNTDPAQHPEVVYIGSYDMGKVIGSGTLISKRVVLTAAHVVHGKPGSDLAVGFGWSVSESIWSLGLATEPAYPQRYEHRSPYPNDLAVLVLEGDPPKPFQDVSPVPLSSFDPAPANPEWRIVGYGSDTQDAASGHGRRRYAGPAAVRELDGPPPKLEVTRMQKIDHKLGICDGDSGGPLLARVDGAWNLVGVASRTEYVPLVATCATAGNFERVDLHWDLLRRVTADLPPQYQPRIPA